MQIANVISSIKRVTIKFYEDSCLVRASGLAYSTLLALVPFITIIYAFGGFDSIGRSIESALLKAIIPTQHEAVSSAINAFTKNSLATGTLGMIFFLLTSIFLINNIARNFDAIWGITSNTNFFRRYAAYTAILVFGSLLLGVSNSIISSVENYITTINIKEVSSYKEIFKLVLPFSISVFLFFLMLTIIPSSKVKIKPGLIGAISSALLFELIKVLFKYWVVNSVKTSLIYGSVAIIPIFLVGLYLTWLIILIGVEISYYFQNEQSPLTGNPEYLEMEEKIDIGIDIYLLICKSYIEKNVGGITDLEIEKNVLYSPLVVNYFISLFLKKNLILNIKSKKGGYIPGRSLDQVKLSDIVKAIYGSSTSSINKKGISSYNSKKFTIGGFDKLQQDSILDLLK